MSLIRIKRLNPLYLMRPAIFWTLFDSKAPSVAELREKHPELTAAEAETIFTDWMESGRNLETQPKGKRK